MNSGNDVCNGHENTLADMTTPAEMYESAMGTLTYLVCLSVSSFSYSNTYPKFNLFQDTKLPAGSDVILLGLADGRVLYEALANRTHPLGARCR